MIYHFDSSAAVESSPMLTAAKRQILGTAGHLEFINKMPYLQTTIPLTLRTYFTNSRSESPLLSLFVPLQSSTGLPPKCST